MKTISKIHNQLNNLNLKAINGYDVCNMYNSYKLYINKKTKQYMIININPHIKYDFKIILAKTRLNKASKCKSVIEYAKSDFFEKEKLEQDLIYKDKLGGFQSILEIENDQIKKSPVKSLQKIIKLIFAFGIKSKVNSYLCF